MTKKTKTKPKPEQVKKDVEVGFSKAVQIEKSKKDGHPDPPD